MHNYTIIESQENFKDSVIEKDNIKVNFTLKEIEHEIAERKRYILQFKLNREIQISKVSNIEEHHVEVKELSDEQLFTIHMYFEAKSAIQAFDKKIEEFEKELEERTAEQDEIYTQLGFVKTTIEAPAAPIEPTDAKIEE